MPDMWNFDMDTHFAVEIKMNKPVDLGQPILDLSKMLLYEFHYDCM